jgi:hypothetical protein
MPVLTIAQRVDNGIALLDEKVPSWQDKVDPSTLTLSRIDACVLGQLFGSYYDGAEQLGFDPESKQASDLGFFLKDDEHRYITYQQLTEEWSTRLMDYFSC